MVMTHTRTYVTTSILLDPGPEQSLLIYAEDFSYDTPGNFVGVLREHGGEHHFQAAGIDPRHVRVFDSMGAFTEWLWRESAVVDKCYIVPRNNMIGR